MAILEKWDFGRNKQTASAVHSNGVRLSVRRLRGPATPLFEWSAEASKGGGVIEGCIAVEMRGTSTSMESCQEIAEVNAARVRRGADAVGI